MSLRHPRGRTLSELSCQSQGKKALRSTTAAAMLGQGVKPRADAQRRGGRKKKSSRTKGQGRGAQDRDLKAEEDSAHPRASCGACSRLGVAASWLSYSSAPPRCCCAASVAAVFTASTTRQQQPPHLGPPASDGRAQTLATVRARVLPLFSPRLQPGQPQPPCLAQKEILCSCSLLPGHRRRQPTPPPPPLASLRPAVSLAPCSSSSMYHDYKLAPLMRQNK